MALRFENIENGSSPVQINESSRKPGYWALGSAVVYLVGTLLDGAPSAVAKSAGIGGVVYFESMLLNASLHMSIGRKSNSPATISVPETPTIETEPSISD